MQKEVFDFFEKNIDTGRPIMLGLSGGPDSTCLLELLLLWNKADVHLVHVDHGWRAESADECTMLQKKANELKLPFHHIKLDPSTISGNLEAESRDRRLAFFREIAHKIGAQGILLGHHADDQSETVFKRVLEGASLHALGIHAIRRMYGLLFLRPLLSFTKKEIITWLDSRTCSYFTDPTNLENKYLRAKFRTHIFPYLRTAFGKEFEKSLVAIGNEAQELSSYLDAACTPYLEKVQIGPWGAFFEHLPKAGVELRHILRSQSLALSRQQLQLAERLLQQGAANKELATANGTLFIDRGRAFFVPKPIPDVIGSFCLKEGSFQFGDWQIVIKTGNQQETSKNCFKDAWKGEVSTYLPAGEYILRQPESKMRRLFSDGRDKEYGHFLNDKKIPHFLMSKVPVMCKNEMIVEDFLTGTPTLKMAESLLITLIYSKRTSFSSNKLSYSLDL